ncbi:family 47 glycoside hydrolase [Lasiosphaeris hirsuta]|uniref:alpha-1,2-Mannosidase n=1 Tax=Lasiosphaeris hirsuta TaxID=260670 RepID=A0AA39ZWF2_9PEZI|nr:family 47 glycoside hydrolase [Lasiosphaeris hirsuta]
MRYRLSLSELLNPPRSAPASSGSSAGSSKPSAPSPAGPGLDAGISADSGGYFVKSSYDWSKQQLRHPIAESDMSRPPQGPPKNLQRVQYQFQRAAFVPDATAKSRRDAVRDAFLRCWKSYTEHALPHDELMPVSLIGKDTFGGWAATMVDALDTLLIMNLKDEFNAMLPFVGALDWADTPLTSINVFETTIRYLGGLLSAYDLSGEPVILQKAIELGDLLYVAFDTPNHMPPFWFDFKDAKRGTQQAGTSDPSASPCSLSLEFTRLSQLTGDVKYFDAIERIKHFLERTQDTTQLPGLWPVFIDFAREDPTKSSDFSLGAQADSLYEYLPKMSALLGGRDPAYEKMYRSAMAAAEKHILFRPMLPGSDDILFSGNARVRDNEAADGIDTIPEGQHLGCFVGGMFGLGGKLFGIKSHIETAERLTRGCMWAYASFPTGIMPEIFGMIPCPSLDSCSWDEDRWDSEKNHPRGFKHVRDPRYILRPEAIESVFLLYRMTGKVEYQEAAWRMFTAIQDATATERANSAIMDVTVSNSSATKKLDSMESFWMAETLKYFYLIFSPPDLISLDEFVFNTEAHPFKRPDR